MQTVVSADGTSIAYRRLGSGPPLLLVHGTGDTHHRWDAVLPALAKRFTLYAMDRRGRGDSGDAQAYSMEREEQDIAAVVAAAEAPVFLLGHSYGGICALEAAVRSRSVGRLVLYEPPIPVPGVPIHSEGFQGRVDRLMEAGEPEKIWLAFLREVFHLSDQELEGLRSSPSWPAHVATAATLPRELRARDSYRFDPRRFMGFRTPTLLLTGGDSPPYLKAATEALRAALPESRVVSLPGQRHLAMDGSPGPFAAEVTRFLLG